MSTTIYMEGPKTGKLESMARHAMHELLKGVAPVGRTPKVLPCGGRHDAAKSFRIALQAGNAACALLVDSEVAASAVVDPWSVVASCAEGEQIPRPDGATSEHLHLMVPCMEGWLASDLPACEEYFGEGFKRDKLPVPTSIEATPKASFLQKMHAASRASRLGAYDKARDSFRLLQECDK